MTDNNKTGIRFEKWEVLSPRNEGILDTIFNVREIRTKKERQEFLNPKHPDTISLREIGLKETELKKILHRIQEAKEKKEKVIVYGDYDADGVCATAILWEVLFEYGLDVMPYIPDRFNEGYGINSDTIKNLKSSDPDLGLIITVDNGIVADAAIETANDLNIDVIITDHHQKSDALPNAYALFHTTQIGGAGVSWVLSREISKKFGFQIKLPFGSGLELAAIGTVADQIPLLGVNRSIVKHGLLALNTTKRPGLKSLVKAAERNPSELSTYDINYVIAPRINAMGRLRHAMDSLRLLCTKVPRNAHSLSKTLDETNSERQNIVEKVVKKARSHAQEIAEDKIIVISGKNYHEGVIGLAASKLVDEFYRPAIVISEGKTHSKASARSINGFSIIDAIRAQDKLIEGGGGHPMAAGFTILTKNIEKFRKEINKYAEKVLTDEILQKKLKIDTEIDFGQITKSLYNDLSKFEPYGNANYKPLFCTSHVEVLDTRVIGKDKKHLKLDLMYKGKHMEAIAFGFGEYSKKIIKGETYDFVYNVDLNEWNGQTTIQLVIKDVSVQSDEISTENV